MIRIVLIVQIVAFMLQSLNAEESWYEIWDRSGSTWYDKWDKLLDRSSEFTDDQKIDYYSKALGVGNNRQMTDKQREIYSRTQELLLSTPGHAEYYEKRILRLWNDFREKLKNDPSKANGSTYLGGTHYDFPVLRHLPSPETVRVLGDMILETEIIDTGECPTIHLASQALQELHHLPLASKPVQNHDVFSDRDLETYRLWYSQIKAGNRTFRFVGDPNEYTLAGPVSRVADVGATSRPNAETPTNAVTEQTQSSTAIPWYAIGMGVVLVVGAFWYWLSARGRVA